MPEEIPEDLQKEFVDVVDCYLYKTIMNCHQNYKRNERKNKSQLILNQVCNQYGDELIDTLIGSEDIECEWDFLNTIESKKLYDALKSLNIKEFSIIKLKFFDNYTNDEINQLLGFKRRNTTTDYINRILKKLKANM